MRKTRVFLASGVAMYLAVSSFVAFAGKSVSTSAYVPASMHAVVTTGGCSNNPGPYITLEGELKLAALNARLIFRNNEKGTHERAEDITVDISLLSDEVIKFAKQPPLGGVAGNPWIYLTLVNDQGHAISNRVLLGRCVQGILPAHFDFLHLTDIDADIAADCSNSPGPYIELSGEISFEGINAVLTFQNSRKNAQHVRDEAVNVEIVILPAGDSIHFAKQPPLDGTGGNPRISLVFIDGKGNEISDEIYLGKCVQLSK